MNKTRAIKSNLDYHFTEVELIALGKELGECQLNLRRLDDDRKMVADEWKAKISSAEGHINSLSNKVSSGYEYRDIECTVTMNTPHPGDKTVTRNDTGAMVKIMPMDESEKQDELPLEMSPETSAAAVKLAADAGGTVTIQTGDGKTIYATKDEAADIIIKDAAKKFAKDK